MSTSTRTRHMRRAVMPVVAIAAAGAAVGGIAVLSGCGSTASAGSAPASIAGYIPASSPLYVQVSTDTAGTQWTNLTRLGTLFPGFGDMRAELDKALAREGIAHRRLPADPAGRRDMALGWLRELASALH